MSPRIATANPEGEGAENIGERRQTQLEKHEELMETMRITREKMLASMEE